MNYEKGSMWTKWDLHVHTPYSIIHHFNGTTEDETWENYIRDLENLPSEIKVLGINDYIFIDGYRRVKQYKDNGRLSNIDLLLPVVELRLDKFGGAKNKLSRINFHVIFSDQVDADLIEQCFLNVLTSKYELSPLARETQVRWNSVVTKRTLEQLGQMIKSTIPEEQRGLYKSDLEEGFNNLNLDKNQILKTLDQHHFIGKYITAVGKTEWADIKWMDGSIAEKKSIINSVDLVFISSYSAEDYHKAVNSLYESGVNDRLLDCSDAHYSSSSSEKDKLGKCYTWLKADTTFEGLKQVLNEWGERVFIGELPPKLSSINNNKGKYISSISVNKINGVNGWFDDVTLQLNHDLVSIIGNKGNGKSALADIIGLAGGTKISSDFSFLTKNRFRQGKLARNFEATLVWENGVSESISLDENPKEHSIEKVKYLPQRYLELLCNSEDDKFENELKKVIFSHVEIQDRHNKSSLNELIQYKSETIKESIRILSEQLLAINEKLIKLENRATPSHISNVHELLKNKEQELEAHVKQKPEEILPPDASVVLNEELRELSQLVDDYKNQLQNLNALIESQKTKHIDVKNKLAAAHRLEDKIKNFEMQYAHFNSNCSDEVTSLGLQIENIVKLNVDLSALKNIQSNLLTQDTLLTKELSDNETNSLIKQREKLDFEIKNAQSRLDEPTQKYHVYKKALLDWETKRDDIFSEITNFTQDISYLQSELQNEITKHKELRVAKTQEIFADILKISEIYSNLYKPVQEFIDKHSLTDVDYELKFEVSIDGSAALDGVLGKINQGVRGKFYGTEEGRKLLSTLLEEAHFSNIDSTVSFLDKLLNQMINNSSIPDSSNIELQLIKNATVLDFYQYLFSLEYLKPFYSLKLGDKEISKLSPGEKGALLLTFYLLVDNDDIPLIIDQPEENLDNQSVFKMLVPCIKEAKKRRQIIMVTHNPNLAVVCDAEQIVHAQMNKSNNNYISYKSGAIENIDINKSIVDILEGTQPAFSNRQSKYSLF
ncbi:DNA repair protein [Paenibacillus sp. PCH8]|uniref:TrlF family AAA-like ATPase n=1 Tax=Paenibacillus sp. PCH8 TaxID=2066524 RepID=UPI000CF9BFA4|nr:ATP-binding protein [Paenibacillus sp. PCH8]PQP80854.1 DNA repair protein [Paenibacillus sp. PCH8]